MAAADGLGLAEVVWEHPLSDTFSLGSENGSWTRAERFAIEFRLPTDDGSYQTTQGPASGDLSPLRYEFALGTAFELAVGKKILLSAGVGVTWMFANQATIIRVDGGQGTAAVSASYAGVEGFSRLGVGIRF